jgi:RNA polymerase sigma factor (sigma-70 family)
MTEFSANTSLSGQSSHRRSEELSLNALDLSRRTYNALIRGGIRSVEELIRLPREQLEHIHNIGPTSLEEIDAQLSLYHARTKSAGPGIQGAPKSATTRKSFVAIHPPQAMSLIDSVNQHSADEWRKTFRPLATNRTPISVLILPEGLKQHLAEAGFNTMADLAQATIHQLLGLPQMGGMSVNKLRTALIAYMLESDGSFTTPPEDKATLKAVTPRCHALAAFISTDVAVRLAEAPLDLVPVERLALNPMQTNELYQAAVYTVGQLVDLSGYLSTSDPVIVALKEYLAALATAGPDRLAHDTISAEALQQHRARKVADVAFWLASLGERDRSVVEERYGLYGPTLTLEEMGQQIGLTRERVRQLEKRALRQLKWKHSAAINAMADALLDYIRKCGGVVTLDEATVWFQKRQSPLSQMDPEGVIRLLVALTDSVQYLRGLKVFVHSDLPSELLSTTQRAIADLLEARMAPTAAEVLLDDFRITPAYQSARSLWSDTIGFDLEAFIRACLRAGDFVEREPGIYARRQWDNRIGDNIIVTLREIGKPTHFTTIADAVNQQLPSDRQTTAHNVHAYMMRYEKIFTRVGNGTYALSTSTKIIRE